jgi:hypothetical protein
MLARVASGNWLLQLTSVSPRGLRLHGMKRVMCPVTGYCGRLPRIDGRELYPYLLSADFRSVENGVDYPVVGVVYHDTFPLLLKPIGISFSEDFYKR